MMNWRQFRNFEPYEFACKCGCNRSAMSETFMTKLQQLRDKYGRPMMVSSGYRCADHPIEEAKETPGAHNRGVACDIAVAREDAYELLKLALDVGFTGIGVNQKGTDRFLHLDLDTVGPRPTVWSY